MSVEATSWVWNHSDAKGAALLVLLRIADQCDKHGANSWPGVRTIEEDCKIQPNTRKAAFRSLVASGELAIFLNEGGSKHTPNDRRPNRYDLPMVPGYEPPEGLIPTGGQILVPRAPRGGNDCPNGGAIIDGTGGQLLPPDPSMIHPGTTQEELLAESDCAAPARPHGEPARSPSFDAFWQALPGPMKKGKATARKTWAKLKPEDRGFALNRLPPYVADNDPRFLKHGSTYLNQRVWEDYEPVGEITSADHADALEARNEERERRYREAEEARMALLEVPE